ncbi:E3 ubiquitin-protein ligase UPL7-like isoform X1 [Chenopodium quinoa]|uniref:E3 ubiquitin-protein ligase UPL7-like isoform X1 n=1 Tax=Chenopodium quinoa TaxID=63459 RepID=UPI000B77EB8C|nr:E3 ubiquitin-protein ligase UPL7-like isoform X1 [Chenopodium quinoa]
MDDLNKHLVSLRGASSKEITRDALLERVSHERELRNYARRASSAALFIQRVWRCYSVTMRVALELQNEWDLSIRDVSRPMSKTWISCYLLRPFLYFITHLSLRRHTIQSQAVNSMRSCFVILLENLSSTDLDINFCALAIGTNEEQHMWNYQGKKLVSLCSFILVDYDNYSLGSSEVVAVTALLLRLVIILADSRGWKCISDEKREDADSAVKDLVRFIGSDKSGLYRSVGRYLTKLSVSSNSSQSVVQKDDKFLITASAITLVLRPFLVFNTDEKDFLPLDVQCAAEQYCLFILTVPWLVQCIPSVILRALSHKSTLLPCFQTLLILNKKILMEYSRMDLSGVLYPNDISCVGWALSNIISLVTGRENGSSESSSFTDGVDIAGYVQVLNILAERFLTEIENNRFAEKERQELLEDGSCSKMYNYMAEVTFGSLNYMDLLRPVCQQWHLSKLMVAAKSSAFTNENDSLTPKSDLKHIKVLDLLDIAHYYSYMIRIYSALNLMLGPLPVLNMLSFTPGFLVSIWGAMEHALFPKATQASGDDLYHATEMYGNKSAGNSKRKQKQPSKDGAAKWVNVFYKISGKSQTDADNGSDGIDSQTEDSQIKTNLDDMWDVESLRCGLESISKEKLCLIHLFCATYAHLLLVLDDIEFYEKQVPFSLEQQRKIASMLNTLVYNGLLHNTDRQNKPIMDAASRCLQMLYERDCRHRFCPPSLWLSPARKSRPPIAMAARTHEVQSEVRSDDNLTFPNMGSFITVTPHVYPFEERVQMFRELIKMDKTSRRMAGELNAPGERSVAIVVRRGHLIEDGFQQLNSLGTRLKSSIHVSFVSECGLPEAGLDYGGLSKEFLTDIAKAAFDPQYGLFCQTSTSERLLIPNTAARFQENGVQMIEFVGRIVGKALYEEILLDYSFSHVFVQKLLGRYCFLDELSTLDPELYRNLMYVKNYEGDVKELSLDFTVTEELLGKMHIIELRPGGKDTIVTNENKLQYIHAMADYKLNRQILPLSNAFYRGLTDLISPSWLKLFNASEFNQLLSGGNHDIDVDDLRKNTRYTGGYSEGSRTVKLFWEVLAGFESKERCMLLKFVTSCSRAPLLGFKHLQPTFTIHKVACDVPLWAAFGGQDVERLPSASTCYNTLKLPTYKRASTLRAKLQYAINSNAGFELS